MMDRLPRPLRQRLRGYIIHRGLGLSSTLKPRNDILKPRNDKKQMTGEVKDTNGQKWVYSNIVEEHFFSPKNVMREGDPEGDYNGIGEIGSPACGDIMKIWLKIDPKTEKILDFKWKTFGCASAIASTSILSTMTIGRTIDEAYKITPREIIEELGGLPKRKIHCSVLGDQALRAAIDNYKSKK